MTYKLISPRIENDTVIVVGTIRIGNNNAQQLLSELKNSVIVQYPENEVDAMGNIRVNPYKSKDPQMNFFTYLNISQEAFQDNYLNSGLVQKQSHKEFPLDIYCYGRKAVFDNVWDGVTSKCRGIVVHRETGEVIARPFEKFHNHGSPLAYQCGQNTYNAITEAMITTEPFIWEKLDGFMCTLYRWEGRDYIASKGSFHSVHAKWATAWYRRTVGELGTWPEGYTPVFEGLHRDLRIVVDYGDREELVLLALVRVKDGAELNPVSLETWAKANNLGVPKKIDLTYERAREESLKQYRDGLGTDEGYVLTWYGIDGPPIRLKMKFIDYLRLHRMVCGVTPWRIWEALSTGNSAIKDWLDNHNATPWFQKFVQKWMRSLNRAWAGHACRAEDIYEAAVQTVGVRPGKRVNSDGSIRNIRTLTPSEASVRKAFALEFTKPENKEFSSALFKMLDREDPTLVIWKYVEGMTKGVAPCRDAQFS